MKQFVVVLKRDLVGNRTAINAFLRKLSEFAGVLPEQLKRVHVQRGCTLVHGFADDAGVERLHEYYLSIRSDPPSHPEHQKFKEFVEEWSIERVNQHSSDSSGGPPDKPNHDRKQAIVLVHGWGGSRDETFGSFPEYIERAVGVPAHVYSYPTGWLKKSPSIAFISRNLDNWIRNRAGGTEVAIVGHSLGGLVVRYLAVLQECRENAIPIRLVSLIASPTDGALLASIASTIPILRSAQLEELRPTSGFLVDVNERWVWWRRKHIPHRSRVGTMYAMDDAVVNYTSAIGADPEAVPIFGVDHKSIVKPTKPDDEAVITLARFCREAGVGRSQ